MKKTYSFLILFFSYFTINADSWIAKDTSWALSGVNTTRAFTINNKAYILNRIFGFNPPNNALFEYDPVLDTWTQKATYPEVTYGGNAAVSIGTNAYIGLGSNPGGLVNRFYEYNSVTNLWTQKANFPGTATTHPFSASISGEVILGSAGDNFGIASSEVWKYSPITNSWSQIANFPRLGNFLQAESYNNEVYVPFADTLSVTTEIWKYNSTLNSWSQLNSCPQFMYQYNTFLINDDIYVGMGITNFPFYTFNTDFWKYSIPNDAWQQVLSYPALPKVLPSSFTVNHFGYVSFGEDNGVPSPEVYQYIPDSTTNIEEISYTNEFSLFPTVAKTNIILNTSQINKFKICDMEGKIIYSPALNSKNENSISIDISSFKSGVYFIVSDNNILRFVKID